MAADVNLKMRIPHNADSWFVILVTFRADFFGILAAGKVLAPGWLAFAAMTVKALQRSWTETAENFSLQDFYHWLTIMALVSFTLQARAEELHQARHSSRSERKVTLDIAGRRVIEEDDWRLKQSDGESLEIPCLIFHCEERKIHWYTVYCSVNA